MHGNEALLSIAASAQRLGAMHSLSFTEMAPRLNVIHSVQLESLH